MIENSKYARVERERKFLLGSLPDIISPRTPQKLIQDHYIIGTNLRLRQVSSKTGVVFKLGKKQAINNKLSKFNITNIYLEEKEYQNLLSLPSYQLHKTRYVLETDRRKLAVDRMVVNLKEIIIAEAEFEDDRSMKHFQLPFSFVREVTDERNYSGFEIAKQYWTPINH